MKKWIERKPKTNVNKGNDILSKLCNIRGIPVREADEFIAPSEDVLFPATDMKNSIAGAERIMKAIDNNEKIVVSADNDTDGVTSTAIIIRYLRERMNKEIPYIFAERDWGHGIKEQLTMKNGEGNEERNANAQRNRELVSDADLLIIVDSSSNDVETCQKIVSEYNTDVLILDHHDINSNELTMADVGVLLVNPQQKGDRYINKALSGAGVVWKMVGLVEELYDDGLIDTDKFIDLAGIGVNSSR